MFLQITWMSFNYDLTDLKLTLTIKRMLVQDHVWSLKYLKKSVLIGFGVNWIFLLFTDRTMSTVSSRGGDSFQDPGSGVVSPFVPVQGQKRLGGDKSRRSKKQDPTTQSSKDKNNCKQQWSETGVVCVCVCARTHMRACVCMCMWKQMFGGQKQSS